MIIVELNLICAVLFARSLETIESQMNQAMDQGAQYVEVRLDGISDINIDAVGELLDRFSSSNIIITLRSEWKSKQLEPPLQGRNALLRKIINLKPSFLDLEYPIDMPLLSKLDDSTTPILTSIDFEGMAKVAIDPMIDLAKKLGNRSIIKLAATPNNMDDLRQLWRWAKKLKREGLRYVVLGMGQLGQISRVKSRELGNIWTYGRFDKVEGEPFLPGMLSIEDLVNANAAASWHLATLGDIPENDALKAIYAELFKASDQNGIFMNLPIKTSPELDQALLWIEDGLLDGLNITKPWQVDILDKIPLKDYSTRIMGSANCVTITKNGLKAYNTQIEALRRSLEPFSFKRINRVYIDGTERIARAIVEVLKDDVEVIVVRDELFSTGNSLFDDYSTVIPSTESYSSEFDLVVNCNTPAKGFENVVMLPRKVVENAKIIFDPMSKLTTPTPLTKLAERLDIKYLGGYQFFFNTALTSFELWTKRSIPPSSIDSELFKTFADEIDFGFMLNY